MPGFTLTFKTEPADALPDRLRKMAGRAQQPPKKAMMLIAAHMRAEVHDTFQRGGQETPWPRSSRAERQSGKTLMDTGRLYKSISFRVADDSVTIGTSDIRARLLYRGGTVRPKNGKFLTIPAADNIKRRARDYANTFLIKNMYGRPTAIGQATGKKKFRVLFYLVKKVVIKPRKFIEVTRRARVFIGDTLKKYYIAEN